MKFFKNKSIVPFTDGKTVWKFAWLPTKINHELTIWLTGYHVNFQENIHGNYIKCARKYIESCGDGNFRCWVGYL